VITIKKSTHRLFPKIVIYADEYNFAPIKTIKNQTLRIKNYEESHRALATYQSNKLPKKIDTISLNSDPY